ncbi:MAG: nuclear transport factor 2 family protein, partial [Acidobacteria bacterium]|nr:nuclear transport factor 2 family protein [Acidobacteriota bacterium]
MKHPTAIVCLVLTSACWNASAHVLPAQETPQQAVDQLLATDRDAGAAGAKTTVVPALTSMFAPDVIMQGPTGMVRGLAAATEALKANPANATATLTWAPVRGGVSSDGQQGFTFGYMTLTPAAGAPVPLKYLAYWVKREGQWRVAAYKRRARPAGDVSTTL